MMADAEIRLYNRSNYDLYLGVKLCSSTQLAWRAKRNLKT